MASTRNEVLAKIKSTPRTRMATRLWASGAVKTKKEAAEIAGITPQYMSQLTTNSISLKSVVQDVDEKLADATVDMSKILTLLGKRAIRNIANLMENAESEATRLKAAVDLADRFPETAKTQKVAVASFSLSGEDAAQLAAAMVESAKIQSRFAVESIGDVIRVELADPNVPLLPTGK